MLDIKDFSAFENQAGFVFKDFLIKIKEDPQIRERIPNKSHFSLFGFIITVIYRI